LSQLTELNLDENQLKIIKHSTFDSLVNVKTLHLHKNYLSSLAATIFKNLKSLEEVDLSENELAKIPTNLFIHNPQLKVIQLYRNKISSISSKIIENNVELITVDLLGNSCIDDKYSHIPSPLTLEQRSELRRKIDEKCEHSDDDDDDDEGFENESSRVGGNFVIFSLSIAFCACELIFKLF
jgi:hypothetical protein